MTLLTSLGLAFSLSMDAFAASLGKGSALDRPGYREAARIAAYFGAFELSTPFLGWLLGLSFARHIEAFDHWVAFFLLLFVGGRMAWLALHPDRASAPTLERHAPAILAATALATSIDAAAVGVTLHGMNVHVPTTLALIGLVTFTMTFFGVLAGRAAGAALGPRAELAGGLGLIAIGTTVLLQHTLLGPSA